MTTFSTSLLVPSTPTATVDSVVDFAQAFGQGSSLLGACDLALRCGLY
jgi:hypothetical protein